MPAVIFDLDTALIAAPPVPSMFFDFMERRHMVRARHRWQQRLFFLRYLARYRSEISHYNLAWLGGMRRADVDVFAEGFVKRKLVDMIRPAMWDRIDAHRAQGDTLILIGQSPQFMLEPLGREIRIEWLRGTVCAYLGNLYLDKPPTRLMRGEEKATVVGKLLADLGADPQETIAYLRDESDLPLMNLVGNPILVSPKRAMLKLARQRDWRVLDGG
ncbi:MAG: haloacid dehalogenase-like hydrolase [Gammaproteobacteria bacterium]|nr:haloacid dehalogenase-like hydrolase [Gammaproteobacteria bacterium]